MLRSLTRIVFNRLIRASLFRQSRPISPPFHCFIVPSLVIRKLLIAIDFITSYPSSSSPSWPDMNLIYHIRRCRFILIAMIMSVLFTDLRANRRHLLHSIRRVSLIYAHRLLLLYLQLVFCVVVAVACHIVIHILIFIVITIIIPSSSSLLIVCIDGFTSTRHRYKVSHTRTFIISLHSS